MRASTLALLGLTSLGVAACGFSVASSGSAGDAGTNDAASDAQDPRPDGPPGATCYGTTLVRVCFAQPPTGTHSLDGTIPTDDDASCTVVEPQTSGPSLCVIAAGEILTGGDVVATGSRPLVLIADRTIVVTNTIDVSSTAAGRCGAGCNAVCLASGQGADDAGGGGGGAGGSFGTIGGTGGLGDTNSNGLPSGTAAGGVPAAAFSPAALRGGCRGGDGGAGSGSLDDGGTGGLGGGAVQLIAKTSITIGGNVYASGAGGTISTITGFQDGGGGGGSGGMIGVDAPTITIIGRLVANGGGGSGGGGNSGGGPGGDGSTAAWDSPAPGGTAGPTVAGPGGTGSAVTNPSSINAVSAAAGAGGGGGGLGVIWIDGTVSGGTMVSPSPTPH